MRQFIFIISLFVILNSHANSLDASQYPYSYFMNDGYVGSGSPTNAIAQIVDELDSNGGGHHFYEFNLGGDDPGESRLTKVIAEVMGNQETSAGYGVGSNLGNGDNDTSLLGRIAQELDGYNLDVSVGSSGTAIDRIEQEFEEKQSSLNSEASTRASADAILTASIVSNSNTLSSVTNSLDVSQYPYSYWMNDGYVGSGSPTNAIAQIVDELNSNGGGHHFHEYNLGGDDPGESRLTKVIAEVMGNQETSAGYGVGSNLGNGDNDTSLLGRIAQELDGYNLDVSVGSSGTAIDRIEQEFEEKQSSLNLEASTRASEDTMLAASIVSNSNTLSSVDSNLLVNILNTLSSSVSNTLSKSVDSESEW